jgi:hypothetical protein
LREEVAETLSIIDDFHANGSMPQRAGVGKSGNSWSLVGLVVIATVVYVMSVTYHYTHVHQPTHFAWILLGTFSISRAVRSPPLVSSLYLRLHQVGNLLLDRLVVQSLQCYLLLLSKVYSQHVSTWFALLVYLTHQISHRRWARCRSLLGS